MPFRSGTSWISESMFIGVLTHHDFDLQGNIFRRLAPDVLPVVRIVHELLEEADRRFSAASFPALQLFFSSWRPVSRQIRRAFPPCGPPSNAWLG